MMHHGFKKMIKATVLSVTIAFALPTGAAYAQADPYLGQLTLYPYSYCPRSWTEASGQLLQISQYNALFSLLGTTYGGDGRITFALPDLRSRVPLGIGQGPGLSNVQLGQKGGLENVIQNTAQLANHTHSATTQVNVNSTLKAHSTRSGNTGTAAGNILSTASETIYNSGAADTDMSSNAIANTATGTTTVNATGGSQSMTVRNPYLGLRWCIALQGIYPPRN